MSSPDVPDVAGTSGDSGPSDTARPSDVGDAPDADTGLLSPVRAGTATAQATSDRAWLRALLDAEAALTRAQAELELAPRDAARVVTEVAADRERFLTASAVRRIAEAARSGGNPVIPLVAELTSAVRERDSGAAEYVHRGATSQDVMDTATMLVASRTVDLLLADLHRAERALARLAAAHRHTPMAARTLTQHAAPTTFGLKAAGWRSLVLDARARLAAVRLPVQLGGAAGTLAAFTGDGSGPADPVALRLPGAYARETGLAEPVLPWHVLRTPVADLGGALAFTAGVLGKLAADVLVLSRTEIEEVAEAAGGGSSAMPHKANPVSAVLMAAAARQLPALTGVLFGSLAAEDERPPGAWHAEWQPLREALRLAGGAAEAAAGLVEGLRVFPERMRANLDATGGRIASERVAAALASELGRSEARALVTEAARRAAEEGRWLADVLHEDPAAAARLPGDRLPELLDPAGYTGAAAALVGRALAVPDPVEPSGPSRTAESAASAASVESADAEPAEPAAAGRADAAGRGRAPGGAS